MNIAIEQHKMRFCPLCGRILVYKKADGRIRRACDNCDFVHWNNPTPVVAAIAEQGSHILLARKHDSPENIWVLIAGYPEAGETLEEAIIREVQEEIGLDSEILGLIGVYSLPWKNQIFVVYRVKVQQGRISVSEELENVNNFSASEIPKIIRELNPKSGAARALRDYVNTYTTTE